MTRFLYLRLALRNVWRNQQTYGPFLLASSLLTFALYSLAMLATATTFSENMGRIGNAMTQSLLVLGLVVVGCFTAVFMIYADSFLIRRRKKELGLYAVLGMEQRHIMRVQLYEVLLSYLVTLCFGLGLGMLMARLMFLILRWLTKLEIAVTGAPNPYALLLTAGLMGAVFLVLLCRHAVAVVRIKPIDLLHAAQHSEKEPKARWLLALLGLACLVAGYWLALTVSDPATALVLFFVAVLLVIVGTYLVFLTTSVAMLKALKARKSFYYTSKHFVTVSGMLYRMKANAAGLASIAILTTMAMVTIGTTSALYLGEERVLNSTYPRDVVFYLDTQEDADAVREAVLTWSRESGVAVESMEQYRIRNGVGCLTQDDVLYPYGLTTSEMDVTDLNQNNSDVYSLSFMVVEEYNALVGTSLVLQEDELGWSGTRTPKTVTIGEKVWQVVPVTMPKASPVNDYNEYLNGAAFVLFPSWEEMESFAYYTAYAYELTTGLVPIDYIVRWDWEQAARQQQTEWDSQVTDAVFRALRAQHPDGSFPCGYGQKATRSLDFYALYGALVFIGIFLGLVFLMGTLLIIYFKQLSEGYQDHDRYIILQKVGMSQQEVRRTVKRQILMVFLAPLLVALCHVGGSLHMIMLMLKMFGLTDTTFIAICSVGAALLVALAYIVFYYRTARTYYRLVQFTSVSIDGK